MLMMTFHLRLKRISNPKHKTQFDLEKLKNPHVLETVQAMIGEKFAPLSIINIEETNLDSMITTFNTAMAETAGEIFDKHRKKKKPWVTTEIFNLCDRRRELITKRLEPEGSEKYREVNNIKKCMKKQKKLDRRTV